MTETEHSGAVGWTSVEAMVTTQAASAVTATAAARGDSETDQRVATELESERQRAGAGEGRRRTYVGKSGAKTMTSCAQTASGGRGRHVLCPILAIDSTARCFGRLLCSLGRPAQHILSSHHLPCALCTHPISLDSLHSPAATTAPTASFPPSGPVADPSRAGAVDYFAAAIDARYASHHTQLALLTPQPPAILSAPIASRPPPPAAPLRSLPHPSISLSMPPSAASPSAPSASSASSPLTPPGHGMPASAFPPLLPADLPAVLADPNALILDLRPFNAYSTARLRGALSLSVPSTLLKRPTYALARLAPMLSSTSARARFATWRDSSRIVVHDADAVGLLERPALLGLLRKFRAEGFDERHQVAWIKGGFNAVWRDRPDLIDHTPLPDEGEEEDEVTELAPPPLGLPTNIGPSASGLPGTLPEMAKSSSAPATTPSFPAQNMKALRTKALPMSAFTSASTLAVPRAFRAPLAPASTEGVSIPTLNDELSKVTTDFARSCISQTAIPPTPAVGSSKQDPLAARGGAIPPTPGPSLLAARASKSLNPTNPQAAPSSAFNLRLPSFTSAPGTTLQPQSTVASQNLHPFPPVAGTSSMPTLSASPGAFPATVSGMRPHRYSVPHGKPVSALHLVPCFLYDTYRTLASIGRGRVSWQHPGCRRWTQI